MILLVPPALDRRLREHAEAGYPNEVCGFLIGRDAAEERRITALRSALNTFEGSKRTRFAIHPRELLAVEDSLEGTADRLVGFYHSHPDHPAAPSLHDWVHAWPTYSYLVVAVDQGRAGDATSWTLRDDRSGFALQPLHIA